MARRVGLDNMSMRMVAEELGVSPMAAYRHVPNRDALVSWVADEMASDVLVPSPDSGTWDERLRALERNAFRAHARVGQTDTTGLAAGPNQLRIVEGTMDILRSAGFTQEDAALAFEVVWAYFHGQLRVYEQLRALDDQPAELLHADRWPLLAEVVRSAPGLDPDDYFDRGFEIVLDGLRARLAASADRAVATTP